MKRNLETLNFAGFWIRFLAWAIDEALLWGILILLAIPFGILTLFGDESNPLWFIIAISWFVLREFYFIYFHCKTGQTIGKKMLNLKVIKENGASLSWTDAFVRWLLYKISSAVLFLGLFWIGIDGKKQGWHDKVAKTYVIKIAEVKK